MLLKFTGIVVLVLAGLATAEAAFVTRLSSETLEIGFSMPSAPGSVDTLLFLSDSVGTCCGGSGPGRYGGAIIRWKFTFGGRPSLGAG